MPYLGKCDCMQCGREVDVSTNRAGMAYYRCAPCGVSVQQKSERGNRMMTAKVRPFDDPDAAPEKPALPEKAPKIEAPTPRESREITEHPPTPAKPATAAKRGGFGFFSG